MSTTTHVGDTLNLKKNVQDSTVKRTLAKIRHPAKAQMPGMIAEKAQDDAFDEEEEQHVTTEQYAGSLGRGIMKESLHYFNSDDGEENLKGLSATISEIAFDSANQVLLSGEVRKTSHLAVVEIVTGTSEGLGRAVVTQLEKIPKALTAPILLVVSTFGGLFMLGLLLALWRFALFGLH